jgi:hypothetical protein
MATPARNLGPGRSLPGPDAGHPLHGAGDHRAVSMIRNICGMILAVRKMSDRVQHCCQGHSQLSTQDDGSGTSAQQTATTGQPWTVRPLLRIRRLGVRVPPSAPPYPQVKGLLIEMATSQSPCPTACRLTFLTVLSDLVNPGGRGLAPLQVLLARVDVGLLRERRVIVTSPLADNRDRHARMLHERRGARGSSMVRSPYGPMAWPTPVGGSCSRSSPPGTRACGAGCLCAPLAGRAPGRHHGVQGLVQGAGRR